MTEHLAIEANGARLDEQRFPGRQGRILFAYLAAQNGRPVPRDELAELLWGEELPATWEKALRVLMTKLRALLEECGLDGSSVLTSAFGCYQFTLPDDAWIDVDAALDAVERAEQALAAGELDEARVQASTAAALARRSFLPGEDGSWVEEKRRDLREALVRSLVCLYELSLGAGNFADAVRYSEELTELEPYRESGYRRLIQAHAAAGDQAEALRVYERCRTLLAEELGAYPSPETESVYRDLLRAPSPQARAGRPETEPSGLGAEPQTAAPPRRARPSVVPAPIWRHPRAVVLVSALALAAAAVLFEVVRDSDAGSGPVKVAGSAVATLDAGSGAVRGTVESPVPPTAMAAGLGFVWVASADSSTVVVVDPETNTVRETIAVESAPGGIAIGGGWVWVTNSLTGTVSQISPQTLGVVQTIPVGNGPTGVAAGDGHVFVANTSDHTVSKLRATDGKLVETFATGPDPGALAFGEGAVWVASKLAASVAKVSPESGEVLDRIPVGDGPAGIAIGSGSVWVANSLSGTVSRIDPRTGSTRGTVEIGSSADAIAFARGDVWVASGLAGTVSRIAARDGHMTAIDVVDSRPTALATGNGAVLVGLRPNGASHTGGTLRVLSGTAGPPLIDTAKAYSPNAWSTLILTNDGLVGWRRVAGQAGTELVPDLAVSLPSVSADGRTYTFQLRRGIRFSDGRLVKASDVRYSIERLYRLKPTPEDAALAYYGGIVGGERCRKRASRCDLSRGVLTDDRAGTVIFRLADPDPEFLFKLALPFAYIVPSGTSVHEAVLRPLPATGPYRIASASRGGSLRLVRNPRFREWSSAAQPDGFPDEILIHPVASGPRRARLVARDEADFATSTWSGAPFAVSPVYRSQLRTQPLAATFYLVLDTTRPPFDDARARRALNYGVDRGKVIRLGRGPENARPTCQVLPPNFPGYERYCPYTLDPSAASDWTAPDLAKARALVRASGTRGAELELWWHRNFGVQPGRYLERLLDSLGYRAQLRLFSGDIGKYFTAVERPGTAWRVFGTAWAADYPAASNFINLLSCSSSYNSGHFCNTAIDAKIRRALELQEEDPAAANASWAALDRDLVGQAPWVSLYTPYGRDLLSKRVGNYQHHPLWGALFAQFWVR